MKKNFLVILLLLLLLACQSDEKQTAMTELAAMTPPPVSQQNNQLVNDQILSSRSTAITRAVERVSDAVCGINVTQIRQARRSNYYDDPFLRFFFSGENSAPGDQESGVRILDFVGWFYLNQRTCSQQRK